MSKSASAAGYPSDVTDEEWEFVLPYLLLCRENSAQRRHDLRQVFNGVRYAARTGGQWRYLPRDYGPWWAVYQQMQRWRRAGVFESLVGDVQAIVREWAGRKGQPTAVCLDSRTLQSTPDRTRGPATTAPSGERAARCISRSTRSGSYWP